MYTTVTKMRFTEMMETEIKTETVEQSHIVMENLMHDDLKTAHSTPATLSEDHKFQSSDDGSESSARITQSTKDINLQLRCRLCAHVNKCMIDIFDFDAASQDIPSMIHLCLPIMVKETDALPKQVCLHCLEELERCYRFHQAVAEAHEQLLVFERLAFDNLEGMEVNWETSAPYNRQHGPTGGTLKKISNIEMSNGKSTNSLGERPTADTSATRNNSSAKKDKKSSTNPKHLNPDSTTEAFDIGTTTASQTVQQSTCDSEVISATCSRSEANARQEKKAERKVDPAVQKGSDAGERRYRCDTCAKKFNRKSHLVRHTQIHSDVRELYRCNECSKMFKSQSDLVRHTQIHSEVRELYRCNVCSKMFKSKNGLSGHQELHTRGGRYSCKYCAKRFDAKEDRKRHYRVHTGERPYENDQKVDPAIQKGSDARERCYRCDTCAKKFNRKSDLVRHNQIHSDVRELYRCNICSKMFKSKHGLSRHQELHTRGGRYSCKYCAKRFDAKEDRKRHYRVHTGELPHTNDLKVDPAVQKQSDAGERWYRCTTCTKRFSQKSNLVEHNKIHSDTRELYKCNLCSKMFKSKRGLFGHQELHARGGLYGCKYCAERFEAKEDRKRHYRVHTG